jgi:Tfp pilus assembly protein PilO
MKPSSGNKCIPWRIYLGGAVVCAAVSAGAYAVAVRPAAERRAAFVARQSQVHAQKQKANKLAGTLNTARADLAHTNETIATLSLRLEPASQVNQRLAGLTALARSSELTIDEMRPGAVTEGKDYKTIPVLIAGNGTYPACATFLHRLRESFPDMAVVAFDTNNNSASPDAPAATFQFDLAWHAAKN